MKRYTIHQDPLQPYPAIAKRCYMAEAKGTKLSFHIGLDTELAGATVCAVVDGGSPRNLGKASRETILTFVKELVDREHRVAISQESCAASAPTFTASSMKSVRTAILLFPKTSTRDGKPIRQTRDNLLSAFLTSTTTETGMRSAWFVTWANLSGSEEPWADIAHSCRTLEINLPETAEES